MRTSPSSNYAADSTDSAEAGSAAYKIVSRHIILLLD